MLHPVCFCNSLFIVFSACAAILHVQIALSRKQPQEIEDGGDLQRGIESKIEADDCENFYFAEKNKETNTNNGDSTLKQEKTTFLQVAIAV